MALYSGCAAARSPPPADYRQMPDYPEVKKIILLPREDVEAFDAVCPQHGAFTWFVREALKRFVAISDNPQDLIKSAVDEIKP